MLGMSSGISSGSNLSLRIRSSRVPSDNPAVAVEQRHGWLIPPAWEFISEVWEYARKPVRETVYDHENEVRMIRE